MKRKLILDIISYLIMLIAILLSFLAVNSSLNTEKKLMGRVYKTDIVDNNFVLGVQAEYNIAYKDSSINIEIEKDNNFVMKESTFFIGEYSIDIPDNSKVIYSSYDKMLILNDSIRVTFMNEVMSLANDDIILQKTDDSEQYIKYISSDKGTLVISADINYKETVNKLASTVCIADKIKYVNIDDLNINIDALKELTFNNNIIKITLENEEIYLTISKFNIKDAELNNTFNIGEKTVYFGDYKDIETGMIPFFIDKEDYLIKIIAKDANIVSSIIE